MAQQKINQELFLIIDSSSQTLKLFLYFTSFPYHHTSMGLGHKQLLQHFSQFSDRLLIH